MSRALVICTFLSFTWVFPAFAQEARIIEVVGEVFARADSDSSWKRAEIDLLLSKDGEIKTESGSSCILAFDEKRKNIIKIDESTEIMIESVFPGKVFLPEGRVFSFIKDLNATEKFEVRTPKAVSGARGTGWLTVVSEGRTEVSCFDHEIYVGSIGENGEVGAKIELQEGLQIHVENATVEYQNIKEIPDSAKQEWQSFVGAVEQLSNPETKSGKPNAPDAMAPATDRKLTPAPPGTPTGPPRPGAVNTNPTGQPPQVNIPHSPGVPPAGGTQLPAGIAPPPGGTGGMPPPPPDGVYPPPPDNWTSTQDPMFWGGTNDGFNDALYEVNQTMIETNIKACGHACCPFPLCCNIFPPMSTQKDYCLSQ